MTDKTDMSLRDAAQAVIDRWETPLWKDAPATAVFIADLRDALARDAGRAALQSPGFSAEDMAAASAQGFRDGAASLAAAEAIPKALPTGWSLADHGDEISLEGPSGERWRYRAASGTGTDSDFIYRFLHASLSANAGEPIRWPKDAAEVREFFNSDFISAKFAAPDSSPCDEDRYYISAHDFLSAINWWADFPHVATPPTAQAEGWISVDERLPDMYKRVLVITTDCEDDPYATPAHYNGPGKFLAAGGHRLAVVTHWQEIDAPPKDWKLPPAKPRVSHRRRPNPPRSAEGVDHG